MQLFSIISAFNILFGDPSLSVQWYNEYYITNINYYMFSFVAIYYSMFNFLVFICMVFLIKKKINNLYNTHITKDENFSSVSSKSVITYSILTILITGLFIMLIYKNLSIELSLSSILYKSYDIRFFITKGFNYFIFFTLNTLIPVLIFLSIIKYRNSKKFIAFRYLFLLNTLILIIILILFSIFSGIRGILIFDTLFILYLVFNQKISSTLNRIFMLKIKKQFIFFTAFLTGLVVYFYYYSTSRGIVGNFLSLFISRADYFLNSYVALLEFDRIIGIRLHKLLYFVEYLIPRDILEIVKNKNYSSTVEITWTLFLESERFGAEFGLLSENIYILCFSPVYMLIASIIVSYLFILNLKLRSKGIRNIKDLIILKLIYSVPLSILTSGIINPVLAELLLFGLLLISIHKISIYTRRTLYEKNKDSILISTKSLSSHRWR